MGIAGDYMRELGDAYLQRPKPQARQPKPVIAVRKYSGRRFTRTVSDGLTEPLLDYFR